MVSYDPFTPPLPATIPKSSPSPTASPLVTPYAHIGEAPRHLPVRTLSPAEHEMPRKEAEQSNGADTDMHEFDGAECCDSGSCVNGTVAEDFNIIPLLPTEEPTSAPTSAPASRSPSLPAQNDFMDFTRPGIVKHPANRTCGTCKSCGLHKGSSVHKVRPKSTFSAGPAPHRHGLPTQALSTLVPDIEAASACPDIHSPTSPTRDKKADPFEVYVDHERKHRRQGSSPLRSNSFSASETMQGNGIDARSGVEALPVQ